MIKPKIMLPDKGFDGDDVRSSLLLRGISPAKGKSGRETTLYRKYIPGTVTPEFLRRVAKLSSQDGGPKLAQEFLAEHGIALVIAQRLKNTHLDGAAMITAEGRPVIGVTLRYDRIDNFWFCLLHELAHLGRHIYNGQGEFFVDDLICSLTS